MRSQTKALIFSTFLIASLALASSNDGANGPSKTIFLEQEKSTNLILKGSDGTPGENGFSGQNGGLCENGENGSSGENGGNGGNGGNAYVYTESLSDLKRLYIDSTPGKGARGGNGGSGGMGGDGIAGTWVCDEEGNNCGLQGACSAGSNGYDGADGYNGADGELGSLFVILKDSLLDEENTVQKIALPVFVQDQYFTLKRHLWDSYIEASSFLADNSNVADIWYQYNSTITQNVRVTWEEPTESAYYKNYAASFDYNADGSVTANLGIFAEISDINTNGLKTITIKKAVSKEELANVRIIRLPTSASDLTILLSDEILQKNKSWISSDFSLKLFKKKFGKDEPLFKGMLGADALTVDANKNLKLDLTKLGIEPKALKGGKDLYGRLTVTRSFLGETFQASGDLEFEIPKN